MGTVLASKIIDDAERILSDSSNSTWTAANHLINLNLTQRIIALVKPDVSVRNDVTDSALSEGTKQSISDDGIQFIGLTNNYGTDGATVGDAITFVSMEDMNKTNPGWHTDTASATVEHYLFDEKDPKHYYVYPPQPSSDQGYVGLIEYIVPDDMSASTDVITLDDIYEPVMLDLLLYLSYSEDAAHSIYAAQRALYYWNKAVDVLGRKDLREKLDSPKSKPGLQEG